MRFLPSPLIIFLIFFSTLCNGQNVIESWAKTAGGTGNDVGRSVALDNHGGVYVAGNFNSPVFTIGNTTLLNSGINDIFLAKYDTSGNFLWAKKYGGTGSESVSRMALGPDGSIYLIDTFRTVINLGIYTFTPTASSNVYLLKLDSNGTVQWAKVFPEFRKAPDVAVDKSGSLYVAAMSDDSTFLRKYTGSGINLYYKSMSANGSGRQAPLIEISPIDNNVKFDYGFYTSATGGISRTNVYDSSGNLLVNIANSSNLNFAYVDHGAAVTSTLLGADYIHAAGGTIGGCTKWPVNSSGSYGAGYLSVSGSSYCTGGSGYSLSNGVTNIQGSTGTDIFYSRGYQLGSTKLNGNTHEIPFRIAADSFGSTVYIIGYWSKITNSSTFNFASNVLTNQGSISTWDMLLLKYRALLYVSAGSDRSICPNGSTIIGTNASGGAVNTYTYSWSPTTGLNNPTIAKPFASPNATTNYVVTVTDAYGAIATDTVQVTVDPLLYVPTISLTSGSNPFCEGFPITLSASAGTSYLWSNGQTTQSITVGTTDTLRVTVQENGCTGTSLPYIVTQKPRTTPPAIQVNGSTTMCNGNSRILTAQSSQLPATYRWSTGASTQSITVNAGGNYAAVATGPNGCPSNPASITIIENPVPVGSIAANGTTTICSGDSLLLTITTDPVNTILWTNGKTTSSIWVKTAGYFTADITSPNGCIWRMNPGVTVTVNPRPPAPIIIASGATTFCTGGSVVLTAQNLQTPVSFLWSTFATTPSITVNASGNYSVLAIGSTGCISPSTTKSVLVNVLPAASISQSGNVLTALPAGASYQWLLNGTAITGATAQKYQIAAGGSYSVNVTDNNGCTANALYTAIFRIVQNDISYRILPNPILGDFNLLYTLTKPATVNVNIISMTGQKILQLITDQLQTAGEHTLVLKNAKARLGKGYFVVIITVDGKSVTEKFLIQ